MRETERSRDIWRDSTSVCRVRAHDSEASSSRDDGGPLSRYLRAWIEIRSLTRRCEYSEEWVALVAGWWQAAIRREEEESDVAAVSRVGQLYFVLRT
jgi:hypothetical protein